MTTSTGFIHRAATWIAALALASLTACSGDIAPPGANGDGSGDGSGNGNGNGNGNGSGSGSGDGGLGAACQLVDLVFAVDGSGSMSEELAAMASEVFPSFATALIDVSGGLQDFRVGVLDACPELANFHTRGATTDDCNFQSGEVWMDSNSTALIDEFSCVGDIFLADNGNGQGCSGNNDDEQPASAAAASLEPPWIDGPNAGFLRDDALLVVIATTDEDEQPTPDRSAAEVFERLVAIKGDPRKMVFLGIGGERACSSSEGAYGGAQEAVKLKEITNLFSGEERGVFWDLCEGRLEDGLTEALTVIETACNELPPIL